MGVDAGPALAVDMSTVLVIPGECLAIITIRNEARNQPPEGQVAVASVIRTRMAMRYSSDGTIAGTVLAPLQFSCWNTNDPQRIRGCQLTWGDPGIIAAKWAWEESAKGSTVEDAVLYHTVKPPSLYTPWPPVWATSPKVELVRQIADHLFYRVKR